MTDKWLEAIMHADLMDGIKHGVAVSNLTYLTAKKLKLSDATCYNLAIAGLVHDIGKLRLSSFLYGRNSNGMQIEEMQYMRTHPMVGYEILKEYGFEDEVLLAVYYHHENYNGSGYPENLKADDIPLVARVLHVADAFTALISERPYRQAFDMDQATSIMIEDIKQYDMEVFLAFMDVIHEEDVMELITGKKLFIDFDPEIFF